MINDKHNNNNQQPPTTNSTQLLKHKHSDGYDKNNGVEPRSGQNYLDGG